TSYGFNIEDFYPSVGSPSWSATMGMDILAFKMTTVQQPAQKLHFNEAHDWWSKWKGANYIDGWDVLGQDGSVNQYKQVGCGGPTMYRHNDKANLAFYDGHVESVGGQQRPLGKERRRPVRPPNNELERYSTCSLGTVTDSYLLSPAVNKWLSLVLLAEKSRRRNRTAHASLSATRYPPHAARFTLSSACPSDQKRVAADDSTAE
ncbi:MAG: H-X9-DG-CTERM domain-containing protein, partial [Planctomycetota bacterium]